MIDKARVTSNTLEAADLVITGSCSARLFRTIYMAGVAKKQFPDYFPSTALRLNQVRAKLLEMYGEKKRKSGNRGRTPFIPTELANPATGIQAISTRRMHRRVLSMPLLERNSQGAITEWKQKYWSERKSSRKVMRLPLPIQTERPQVLNLKKGKRGFLRKSHPQPPPNSGLLSPLPSPQLPTMQDLSSLLSPIGNRRESAVE